jgi:hypothetical protein
MFLFLAGEQAVERLSVTSTMIQFKCYIVIKSVIGGQFATLLIQPPSHCEIGFLVLAPEYSG